MPYDCGIAFVREPDRLARALNFGAPYLPRPDDPRPNFGFIAPESSRRSRALNVWATLPPMAASATGRWSSATWRSLAGSASGSTASPTSSASPTCNLNIVCFRARPDGVAEDDLDDLNRRLGERLIADGRVFSGTTVYDGKVAFRPAIVNWQTTEADVQMLIDVLVELLEEER